MSDATQQFIVYIADKSGMGWQWTMLLMIGSVSMISAQISCKFEDKSTFLVCSPGDSDYTLRRGDVSDNNQTYGIKLKGCRILDFNTDSFHGLPFLVNLDVSFNGLKKLKLGIFDELPELRYLNMSHNLIVDIPVGLLANIRNLLELDLSGNHLLNLNPGAFMKISMLYLSHNTLRGSVMNPDAFESSDINFLLFANNNMENAPDGLLRAMTELVYLNLEECSLTVIPKFITTRNLNTLVHLTLIGNKIKKITDMNTFNNLDDLRVLNLTQNLIEEIDENAFAPLKKLEKLDLSKNKLHVITDSQFRNFPELILLDLSRNFITMLPVNAFRGTKLNELNLSDNRITYLQDNFCLELKNSGAVLKAFYFNRNPWQCACLKQLLREVKSMNLDYDSENYDGKKPVCVTTSQFVCKRHEADNKMFLDMYDSIKT